MRHAAPTLVALALLAAPSLLAQEGEWTVHERDIGFLVPGRTTYDEVIARWGTHERRGTEPWDVTARLFLEWDREHYVEIPELRLTNAFLEPLTDTPDWHRYSVLNVPDGLDPERLTRRRVRVVLYRRFLTFTEDDEDGDAKIRLAFDSSGDEPGRLLYFAVDIRESRMHLWREFLVAHQSEGEVAERTYTVYRGTERLGDLPLLFVTFPSDGIGYQIYGGRTVASRLYFPRR